MVNPGPIYDILYSDQDCDQKLDEIEDYIMVDYSSENNIKSDYSEIIIPLVILIIPFIAGLAVGAVFL